MTNFYLTHYPAQRILKELQNEKMPFNFPLYNSLSIVVKRFLWQVATIEEYKSGALISVGKEKKDLDFLWVISGKMTFKLHNCILNGDDCKT